MRHGIPARFAAALGALCLVAGGACGGQPTDNPAAAYYSGPEGYPAWTDRIRWANAIDVKTYARGTTDFGRFENARDELAAKGGGVLYYPAGTYDFSAGRWTVPTGAPSCSPAAWSSEPYVAGGL